MGTIPSYKEKGTYIYRIAGNFQRERFTEISEMLDTF